MPSIWSFIWPNWGIQREHAALRAAGDPGIGYRGPVIVPGTRAALPDPLPRPVAPDTRYAEPFGTRSRRRRR